MASSAMSPGASPRLPSPPPMPEDQLGPQSPTTITASSNEEGLLGALSTPDHGSSRRIRPGTKSSDMAEGPPVIDISEIDTAYQLSEHLKALYNAAIHPTDSTAIVPLDRPTAVSLATPPKDIDRAIWLYELCRFLCMKVNKIIIGLFSDEPPCSAQTCSEMRASEWQYLCAVHDPPKPCCAIDYCCHTLDWAANVLTSQKHFPSRMTLGLEHGASHQQMRQLTNIFRRVYRIFAHAWFQHRDMFWKVEKQTGLYLFFKTVCDVYSLIPEDNYTIPPDAEGRESAAEEIKGLKDLPIILNRSKQEEKRNVEPAPSSERVPELPTLAGSIPISTGHTTKRHRQTPSVDSGIISTVLEDPEEDDSKSVAGSVVTTVEDGETSLADSLAQMNAPKVTSKEVPEPSTEKTKPEESTEGPEKKDEQKAIADDKAAASKEAPDNERPRASNETVPILLPTSEVLNNNEEPQEAKSAENKSAEPQRESAETAPEKAQTESNAETEPIAKQQDEHKSPPKTESKAEEKSKDEAKDKDAENKSTEGK